MSGRAALLDTLGGEEGCRRLSESFYARVAQDAVLRPLFPGKSLRCATEEFAAFLIQFLGGDEAQTQSRWWLSLRESHARFRISPAQRAAWLKQMTATLEAASLDAPGRAALRTFFVESSAYVAGGDAGSPEHEELAACWREQCILDDAVAAIAGGSDGEAIALTPRFEPRRSVFVGLLARMMRSESAALIRFTADAIERDPPLAGARFAGRSLLHFASAAGCVEVVGLLLRIGTDPDVRDRGGHTPLYAVANECGSERGPEIAKMLLEAGANVNDHGGVTRATPLHMAARRGYVEIARVLLDSGAAADARDRKGDTPLDRAIHCRRKRAAQLLIERGAPTPAPSGRRPAPPRPRRSS